MSVEVPIQGAVEAAESYVSAAAYASEQSSSSTITGEDSGGQSSPMSVEAPSQGAVEAAETDVSAAAYASEQSSASISTGEDGVASRVSIWRGRCLR